MLPGKCLEVLRASRVSSLNSWLAAMRPQILRSLPLILVLGCTVAKGIDYIEPGTVCEIIPWQPKWSTRVNEQAELNFRSGSGVLLTSGTRIAVLRKVPPRNTRFRNTVIPQSAVHVLDGPYKDVVGVVMLPHLRVTSEPKRLDLVEPEPPPAQPATPKSEANEATGSPPKDASATPKRADAAEPTSRPEHAAKSTLAEETAPATQ